MEDKKVLNNEELEKVTGGDRELSQLTNPNALGAIPSDSPILKAAVVPSSEFDYDDKPAGCKEWHGWDDSI